MSRTAAHSTIGGIGGSGGEDEEAGAGADGRSAASTSRTVPAPMSRSPPSPLGSAGGWLRPPRVRRASARMPGHRPHPAPPRSRPGVPDRGAGRWPRRAPSDRVGDGRPAIRRPPPWEAAAPPHPRSSSRRGAPPADEVTSRDQRRELGPRRRPRRLAEAAVRDEVQPVGVHAGVEQPVRRATRRRPSRGTSSSRRPTPAAEVATGRGDVGRDVELGHLAVGELQAPSSSTRNARACSSTGRYSRRGERPPEVVAEAQVRAQPDPADRRFERAVEQRWRTSTAASGWMAGDGSSIWIDTSHRRRPARRSRRRGWARTPRRASTRSRYTWPGPQVSRPDSVNGPGSVTLMGRWSGSARSGTPRRRPARPARRSARGPGSGAAGRGRPRPADDPPAVARCRSGADRTRR